MAPHDSSLSSFTTPEPRRHLTAIQTKSHQEQQWTWASFTIHPTTQATQAYSILSDAVKLTFWLQFKMHLVSLTKISLLPSSMLKRFCSCSYHPISCRLAAQNKNSNSQSGSFLTIIHLAANRNKPAQLDLYIWFAPIYLQLQLLSRMYQMTTFWKVIPKAYSRFLSLCIFLYCLPNYSFFKTFF